MKHPRKIALALALMGMILMSPPGQASDVFETYFINMNGVMHEISYDPSLKLLDDRVNGELIFADVYEDEESNEAIHHKIDAYIAGLEKGAKAKSVHLRQDFEIDPDYSSEMYGKVVSIIDGKPISGWAKYLDVLCPVNGEFKFNEQFEQFGFYPLLIKADGEFMNIDYFSAAPAESPLEYHVSPTDPTSPFWHHGELTTDMLEALSMKWVFRGNDYKTDPLIFIFFNRTAGKPSEVAALDSAVAEWNTKWKGAAQTINAYIDEHQIQKPHMPEVLFGERSHMHSSTQATTDHEDHYGVNIVYGSGLNQTGVIKDYDKGIFFATVNLTNPNKGVAMHELGHVLGAYHTENNPSIMSRSPPGTFMQNDLQSFIIAYFDSPKFVKYLTNEDVDVTAPSPVENSQIY